MIVSAVPKRLLETARNSLAKHREFPTMKTGNSNDFFEEKYLTKNKMCGRITSSGSYDEALGIIGEYVNITQTADAQEQGGMEMHQSY